MESQAAASLEPLLETVGDYVEEDTLALGRSGPTRSGVVGTRRSPTFVEAKCVGQHQLADLQVLAVSVTGCHRLIPLPRLFSNLHIKESQITNGRLTQGSEARRQMGQ